MCRKVQLPQGETACTPLYSKCYDQCTNELTRHEDIPSSSNYDDNDYESEDAEDN